MANSLTEAAENFTPCHFYYIIFVPKTILPACPCRIEWIEKCYNYEIYDGVSRDQPVKVKVQN